MDKHKHSVLVPSMDALIGDPKLVRPNVNTKKKADKLLIPSGYVDKLSAFSEEYLSGRGESARDLLHSFAEILRFKHENQAIYTCDNGMLIEFTELEAQPYSKSTTKQAITVAKNAIDQGETSLAILTGKDDVASRAYLSHIDVARINPENYYGRRQLILTGKACNEWLHKKHFTDKELFEYFDRDLAEKPLKPNEFVEFIIDEAEKNSYVTVDPNGFQHFIGRYSSNRGELAQIHYFKDISKLSKNCIYPKTAGQAMLLEALLAPSEEIPIVICPSAFGTGKTFLAVAAGLALVKNKRSPFEEIFVVPRDSNLGAEIGFVPGSEFDKTIVKAMPIVDNIKSYIRLTEDVENGKVNLDKRSMNEIESYFEFRPLISMGGRSIPNAWIIYDEAQDMERYQINQLMKRIGDNSKMIITGDPSQVFNRHMNAYSNGLSYAATHMANSPQAAIISMNKNEIVRSEAAREIAAFLDY